MMKWVLTIGLIALVIVAAFAFPLQGNSAFKFSDLFSPSRLKETPASSDTSEFSVNLGNTTYRGTATSEVGVAVMDVMSLPSGVVAMVGVYNGKHEAITLSPSLFQIVDAQGNVYSGSEYLSPDDALSVAGKLNHVFMNMIFTRQFNPGVLAGQSNIGDLVGPLNPRVTKCGLIVFEVPPNLSSDQLMLRFGGSVTGNSVDLPLKVNSSVHAPPSTNPRPQPDATAGTQQDTTFTPQPNPVSPQPSGSEPPPVLDTEPASQEPSSNSPTPQNRK